MKITLEEKDRLKYCMLFGFRKTHCVFFGMLQRQQLS